MTSANTKLTHSVDMLGTRQRWPAGTGTYEVTDAGFGAASLDEAEAEIPRAAQRLAKCCFGGPHRGVISRFCRRCFAGDGSLARNSARVDACPCCYGTLKEPLYAPEMPEDVAEKRALENVKRLAREARRVAERKAWLEAQERKAS